MNFDLSLMAYMFREKLNRRFVNAEKRFSNDESKIKFFHINSRSRIKYIFSSGNSLDITACFIYKTIEWHYQFYSKVNLENEEGKETIRYALYNKNNILKVEITNKNDSIVEIDIPAPIWNEEIKDYEYEDNFLPNGYKVTLFEPIILRFKRNDCISNFWLISNRCTKWIKFNDPATLALDLGCSS